MSLCDYFSEYRINPNRINPEQEPYQRAETAAQMQICTILTVTPIRSCQKFSKQICLWELAQIIGILFIIQIVEAI